MFRLRTWQYLGLLALEVLFTAVFGRLYFRVYFEPMSMLWEFENFYYFAFLVGMSTYVGFFVALFAAGRAASPELWGLAGILLTGVTIWSLPDLIPEAVSITTYLIIFLMIPLFSTALLSVLIALHKSAPKRLDDEIAR